MLLAIQEIHISPYIYISYGSASLLWCSSFTPEWNEAFQDRWKCLRWGNYIWTLKCLYRCQYILPQAFLPLSKPSVFIQTSPEDVINFSWQNWRQFVSLCFLLSGTAAACKYIIFKFKTNRLDPLFHLQLQLLNEQGRKDYFVTTISHFFISMFQPVLTKQE